MDDINWLAELTRRDIAQKLTDANREYAVAKAEDAAARIADEYPAAWLRAGRNKNTRLSVISIVAGAVFRVLRDAESDGRISESDGVYNYRVDSYAQSPDVMFTAQDREYLSSWNNAMRQYAFGSLRRTGVSGCGNLM